MEGAELLGAETVTLSDHLVTLHCSASRNGQSVSASEIRTWHLERGFKDIGYAIVIDVDGTKENGRPLNETGAHVAGANEKNIGICLVGDDRFSVKQFDTLRHALKGLEWAGWKPWNLRGHYEFKSAQAQGKTCPSIPTQNILHWYLQGLMEPLRPYLFDA